MSRSFRNFLLPFLLAVTLLLSQIPFFSLSADAYGTVNRTVYVSASGSDNADGTRTAPYQTVAKALSVLCSGAADDNGGTIVLTDDPTPDESSALSSAVMSKYSHKNLLTFTGRDPFDGTLYSATLRYDPFGLAGPTKFEYLTFAPSREYCFVNTCGKPLIIGQKTSVAAFSFRVHDGIGESCRGTVSSTDMTMEDGAVATVFVGGGYARNTSWGVAGNCTLTVNGGHIANVRIGFDKYPTNPPFTDGNIGGNVTIAVNGNGTIGNISVQNIENNTIGGALTIIFNQNKTASFDSLPNAEKGVWRVFSARHGKVEATDTIGEFRVTPDKGYSALLNGEAIEGGVHIFPQGDNEVRYVRDDRTAAYDGVYALGDTQGNFEPDSPITRAEGVMMLYRTFLSPTNPYEKEEFSDISSTDWYYDGVCYFENYGILPEEWTGQFEPSRALTRAEFVVMAERIYPHITDSYKLFDFSDLNENTPHYEEILTAYNEGKINGYGDGTLRLNNEITRAEAVTILNRYTERKPLKNTDRFADVPPSHWANKQIAAASEELASGFWEKSALNESYVLPSSGKTEDAVKALYVQSRSLSADAIREGIDTVSEQMKKNILNSTDSLTVSGTCYYVSEKNGDDSNDGKSKSRPIKTLSGLRSLSLKEGDGVFFERGGIYRGSIDAKNGVTYAAYGTGEKPLLMQSRKNYASPELWVETEFPNVWKCTDSLSNVGVIGFDHDLYDYSESSYHELYGDIMNLNTKGFTDISDLNADLQFYSVISGGTRPVGALYLYSEKGNPGSRFSSIEIGERQDIFDGQNRRNITIDNLAFKFTGAHAVGFGNGSDIVVTNCVFSWLGGSVLTLASDQSAVNYGNAVEIYGSCDGYRVENCWMYQIYDTAVTHQRSASLGNCIQTGVRYLSNLMEYVHWGIEFYNAPPSSEDLGTREDTYTRYTSDVYDAYNVLRMGGYGWGSVTRFRQSGARLYCGAWLSDNYGELTEYNIFDRCAGYLLSLPDNANETDDKNIYVQTLGKTLGALKGTYRICTRDAYRDITEYFGDKNAVVIVTDE